MAASAGTADGIISSTAGSGADSRAKYTGDISALDNTLQGWGQGVQFDSLNRPQGAVTAQGKYGKYSADFIRTDESDAKRIYLTFDEGYENGYTSQILDVLKEKNCPAVFFVTMPYVKQQPELIRRMIDEGHIVGNHSVTHPSGGLPSQSREQQERELLDLHDYVKENFGYEMSLFRYPAGKFSEQSLAIVQSVGYTSVFWSFAYKDWDPDNQPEETAALAKLKERAGIPVLFIFCTQYPAPIPMCWDSLLMMPGLQGMNLFPTDDQTHKIFCLSHTNTDVDRQEVFLCAKLKESMPGKFWIPGETRR